MRPVIILALPILLSACSANRPAPALAQSGPARAAVPAPPAAPAKVQMVIDVDKPGVKVSPMLYGIFFEEINCAGDGGLYAELVRNRSFEDSDKPDHWRLVTDGSRKGEMAIDAERPVSEKNRKSLRLKVGGEGDGRVGVANGGWWGIAIDKGAGYDFSLYARADEGFKGPLAVTLQNADGSKTYADGKIEGVTGDWKRFALALTATDADPKARLVISASQPGTVWLDVVSLFPKATFKNRPNGLRPDLAKMLADLRPSFVRFPGGCWVEGDTLALAMRWKATIGDIADRRTQYNIWQYMSTNGLGYHEYLQMCEDLGAEPLFVINCGMSHRENVPMQEMKEWVQDALDAIEYANGPADSTWGSLRAKAGHPAPFNLKYMEIGNENGGPAYLERYNLFYDAIKARYPEMRLIADVPVDKAKMEIVDEHYYSSPDFFMSNAHRYDSYDRRGPKIYVGEYAVTQGAGQGNLRAALGEAAFMTGMERNSDVVVMASYAPLFCNVNYKKWNPDLIDFDSSRVYGIPSYWVQRMFSENRGEAILPLAMTLPPAPAEAKRGAVGVGTWITQAEYKDLKVTKGDKVLYESNFATGAPGFKTLHGEWKVEDGAYRQTSSATDVRAVVGDPAWSDYTYTLKARKLGGAEGFLIMFHVLDNDNYAWWNLGGWGNSRHAIEVARGGGKSLLGREVRGKIETGRWYDIRIETQGQRIRCFLDGKLVHDVNYGSSSPVYAVAGQAGGEVILKVVNAAAAPQETVIKLRGAGKVERKGAAIVLTSEKPADENSLAEPMKVAPVTRTIDNVAAEFRHTFPPNSVTILRLKAAP
jgi:alpha-L-arabinofuranosidase